MKPSDKTIIRHLRQTLRDVRACFRLMAESPAAGKWQAYAREKIREIDALLAPRRPARVSRRAR